jgi:Uma2 family endonuclease
MSTMPRQKIEASFTAAAQQYLHSLPLEHHMEATPQATQRAITLASLALVHARRPEVQVFNELLIQYRLRGSREIHRVVPDNMVVVWNEPIQAEGSYDMPLQPIKPLWVLEYVSKSNKRKDYEESHDKYERDLKIPYYLLFYPETQDLTLYKHNGRKYVTVLPDDQNRYPIPDLELEVGLLDGWVRYWFRGELLLLPGDLQRDLDAAKQQVTALQQRVEAADQRAEAEKQRAEAAERQAAQDRQALMALQQELERLRATRPNGR